MKTAQQLVLRIGDLKEELKSLEARLSHIQRTCKHEFGEVTYVPDIREAYTSEGDTPGTMGIDWRGPTYVPRSEKKKWRRICGLCELIQTTDQVRSNQRPGSLAGTMSTEEVPHFSNM